MKNLGTELKLNVSLLPLDSFQRHLLSGISGVLVWFVISVWPFQFSSYRYRWNWTEPAPLLTGLVDHLSDSLQDMDWATDSDAIDFIAAVSQPIFSVVPTIIGIALLLSIAIVILGAFKIVTYPTRIQRFAPAVLGSTLVLMLLVQVVAQPAYSITQVVFPEYQSMPNAFSFDLIGWIEDLLALCLDLAIPTAVFVIALIPILSPEKNK
jgi:hypothetical protein